jgi:hypothetical protein
MTQAVSRRRSFTLPRLAKNSSRFDLWYVVLLSTNNICFDLRIIDNSLHGEKLTRTLYKERQLLMNRHTIRTIVR